MGKAIKAARSRNRGYPLKRKAGGNVSIGNGSGDAKGGAKKWRKQSRQHEAGGV